MVLFLLGVVFISQLSTIVFELWIYKRMHTQYLCINMVFCYNFVCEISMFQHFFFFVERKQKQNTHQFEHFQKYWADRFYWHHFLKVILFSSLLECSCLFCFFVKGKFALQHLLNGSNQIKMQKMRPIVNNKNRQII